LRASCDNNLHTMHSLRVGWRNIMMWEFLKIEMGERIDCVLLYSVRIKM